MVGIRRREQVIRNIGTDILPRVLPGRTAGDLLDLRDLLLLAQDAARVRVAFDVVFVAGPAPAPLRRPLDVAVVRRLDEGALVARRAVAAAVGEAPLVVVEVPGAIVGAGKGVAELGGRGGDEGGGECHEGEELGLHLGGVE